MSIARTARLATLWLWAGVVLSVIAWSLAGYPRLLCAVATVPLLAPLRGLVGGKRYTYKWATLFAIPYVIFAVTELLVNRAARWPGSLSLMLTFAWVCAMVLYLRASRVHPG